jgi:hypothetical protein
MTLYRQARGEQLTAEEWQKQLRGQYEVMTTPLAKKQIAWQGVANEYVVKATGVQEQLDATVKEIKRMTTPAGPLARLIWPGGYMPPSSPLDVGVMNRLNTSVKQYGGEMIRYNFMSKLYSEAPAYFQRIVAEGRTLTVEDAVAALNPPPELTSDELTQVRDAVEDMLESSSLPVEPEMAKDTEVPELPALQAPQPREGVKGIHRVTIDLIRKSLLAARIPDPILSEAEYKQFLVDSGKVENLGQAEEYAETAEEIIKRWQDRDAEVEAFRQGMSEIPSRSFGELLGQMVLQPGLAMADIMGVYSEHVSAPLAGLLYANFVPDIHTKYDEYLRTEGAWRAAAHAWADWDQNWALKYLVLEGLVDPLNYVGFGLGAKLTKPIPALSRVVGAAEKGLSDVLELPFDAIKYGVSRIPKTPGQLALRAQHQAQQLVEAGVTSWTHKTFGQLTQVDFAKFRRVAVKYVQTVRGSQSESVLAQAGREFLKHAPVDMDTAKGWALAVKSGLTPDQITSSTVSSINDVFEDMFTHRKISTKEAGVRVAAILGQSSDESVKVAVGLVDSRAKKILAGAAKYDSAKTPYKAMQALGHNNYRLEVATQESVAYFERQRAGRMGVLLHDIPADIQRVWSNYIDKLVVKNFAEAYLTFGMYGPMNVIEDMMRSALGGVIPRRMGSLDFSSLSIGLVVDPISKHQSISDMMGALRTGVDAASHNNWVNTLGFSPMGITAYALTGGRITPARFAREAYRVMVEMPGGISADIRRNFIARRYLQILQEKGGPGFKALVDAMGSVPKLVDIDKKLVKQIETELYHLATTGDDKLVRGAKELFTRKNIVRQEVRNVLAKYPDLPIVVRQHVLDAYDSGELLARGADSIEEIMREGSKLLTDEFLKSPELASKQFEDLSRVLTNMAINNPEEMAGALIAINKMSEIYGAMPKQIISQANLKSRGLPYEQRNPMINKALDDIAMFRDRGAVALDAVVDKMRKTVLMTRKLDAIDWTGVKWGKGISETQQARIKALMDELPFTIKQKHITSIDIDKTKIAEAMKKYNLENVAAYYHPHTGGTADIVLSSAGVQKRELYHEIGHGIAAGYARAGDFSLYTEYAKALNIVVDFSTVDDTVKLYMKRYGWGLEDSRLQAIRNVSMRTKVLSEANPNYDTLEEHLAESFLAWCSPDDSRMLLTNNQRQFFQDHFPKRQQDLKLPPEYAQAADSLFTLQTAKRVSLAQLNSDMNEWRRGFFANASKQELKESRFWDSFYTELDGWTHKLNVAATGYDSAIEGAIKAMDTAIGVSRKPRAAIVVRDRPLAPADVAQLLETHTNELSSSLLEAITIQNDRDMFVRYVMGKVGKEDVGFSDESVGRVFDQIAYSLGERPESMSWLSAKRINMEGTRQELHALYARKLLPDDKMQKIHKYIDDVADRVGGVGVKTNPEYADYNQLRQASMDEAHKWYYKEYVDYSNANAFDAMMKAIYPYWTYESQRWFYLPRQMLKHPVTFTTLGRYNNYSDDGYIHVPGTSIDISPFRGTVWGAVTGRLTKRDYPEYYDSLPFAGGLVGFNDFLSRYGFYPGAHMSIPLALLGGRESQFGEVLPATYKTLLDTLVAVLPESSSVRALTDRVFPDRFRDYLTIKEINRRGGKGSLLFAKRTEGPLTDEEQAEWDSARRVTAMYSAGFEQFGLFRFRPEEQIKMQEEAGKAIEDMVGITVDQQEWYRRHGYNMWDIVGGLSPEQIDSLKALGYYQYAGSTRPLMPSAQQDILNNIELAWDSVHSYSQNLLDRKLQLQRDFMAGTIGPSAYREGLLGIYNDQRGFIDNKAAEVPEMLLENRAEYYKKYGVAQPVQHPMQELINLYFTIELKDMIDPETGEKLKDWDTFWAERAAIEQAIPEEYKGQWQAFISKNTTRVEELRREVSTKYFRKYDDLYEQVLAKYSIEEQSLLKEFFYLQRTGQQLERQQLIRETMTAGGKQLVSDFQSDVSSARKALRYANPALDAWLLYWGRTTSFTTQQAELLYKQLAADTGRTI